MWNWFGGEAELKLKLAGERQLNFLVHITFVSPLYQIFSRPQQKHLMDNLLPPTHSSSGWTERLWHSVTYLELITSSVKNREGGGWKVGTHTRIKWHRQRSQHGVSERERAKPRETRSLFPQINTNGKRQSVPLMLHRDKVLHKFIWALQVDSF